MALYSVFVRDQTTMHCLLDFQEIKFWTRKIAQSLVEFQSSTLLAQWESYNPLKERSLLTCQVQTKRWSTM
jgi:hypothetical protein